MPQRPAGANNADRRELAPVFRIPAVPARSIIGDLCKTPIHRSGGRQTAAFSNEIIEAALCRGAATPVFAESNARTNQAGLEDRPEQ